MTFQWDEQTNSVVMAKSITAIDEKGNAVTSEFEIDVYKRQERRSSGVHFRRRCA